MPQSSYPFAVARIRALENKMIDSARMNKIAEASDSEAFKLLFEVGYGEGASHDVGQGGVEALIDAQLSAVRKVVWDITPDPALTGLFLLPIDAHNIKTLLKARLLNIQVDAMLIQGGVFPVELLARCVQEHEYKALPEAFRDELNEVEHAFTREIRPALIGAAVDRAVFAYTQEVIAQHKNQFVQEYFRALSDFTNVLSVIRARALNYEADKLNLMLLPGGELTKNELLEGLTLPADQLSKRLGRGANGTSIAKALDEYAQTGNTNGFEYRLSNARVQILKAKKHEPFSLAPIIGYLVGREIEASALRSVFAAKRSGIAIQLVELYA